MWEVVSVASNATARSFIVQWTSCAQLRVHFRVNTCGHCLRYVKAVRGLITSLSVENSRVCIRMLKVRSSVPLTFNRKTMNSGVTPYCSVSQFIWHLYSQTFPCFTRLQTPWNRAVPLRRLNVVPSKKNVISYSWTQCTQLPENVKAQQDKHLEYHACTAVVSQTTNLLFVIWEMMPRFSLFIIQVNMSGLLGTQCMHLFSYPNTQKQWCHDDSAEIVMRWRHLSFILGAVARLTDGWAGNQSSLITLKNSAGNGLYQLL